MHLRRGRRGRVVAYCYLQNTTPRTETRAMQCLQRSPRFASSMSRFLNPSQARGRMQVKRFTTSTASLSVKAICRAVSSYSIFITSFFLVSDADQVVTKLLDGVGGGAGLDSLGIVGDKDGLGGLDDDNTLTALGDSSIHAFPMVNTGVVALRLPSCRTDSARRPSGR